MNVRTASQHDQRAPHQSTSQTPTRRGRASSRAPSTTPCAAETAAREGSVYATARPTPISKYAATAPISQGPTLPTPRTRA